MARYSFKITLNADTETEAKALASLIQKTVNTIDKKDIMRLLAKVVESPSIVKTALKFI